MRTRRRLLGLLPLLALALSAPPAAAQGTPHYALLNHLDLGGDGGWDYLTVDASRHRLFVSRGTHVQVVDLATGKLAGDIPNTPGVHGIALVPAVGKGFTSDGRDSAVTVFDLSSLKTTGTIHVPGRNPDAIVYDPGSRHVFTMNGGSGTATAIDPATGKVVGSVELGGKPEEAAPDGQGLMFVNLEDKSEVAEVDSRGMKVLARWSLAPCEEPTGLTLDRAHHRLFVGCGNRLMAVMDARSGKVLATVPVGEGVDGVAYDAATGLAFSPNGRDGTVTVVKETSPGKFEAVETVRTETGARTIALDPTSHRLYLSTAKFGPRPAAATADNPRRRPPMVPGSFTVLVVGPARS